MYLNCKTYYSLRYGTYSTEGLVKAAVERGATSLALTNINTTADAWDFVQYCREVKIKPMVGAEIRNGNRLLYVLVAANNRGLYWINRFLSHHLVEKKTFPEMADTDPFFDDTWDGYVIYPWGAKPLDQYFSNERLGILPVEVRKISMIGSAFHDRLVIRQPVTVQDKGYFNVHRLLRCIDENALLSKLDPRSVCQPHETFVSPGQLLETFKDHPFIVSNTCRLADSCGIGMDFGADKNKKTFGTSAQEDRERLSTLASEGLAARYGSKNKEARERLEKELQIIDKLGFNAYFLITWDIIRYAKQQGYYHVGRGSGANSIVAYCLQITDVDPVELDLYFERFLNPHRSTPPDFDIDFSWADRDAIIEYVFRRYGQEHVALLGTVATFQYNAIIRELGKVFGLPKSEIDELAEKGYYNGDTRSENFMKKKGEDRLRRLILQYGKYIQHFPDHLSIHPGGMLISERPLAHYTAVHLPPKGFQTTQIDMFTADDIGLYKLDILSQRGLGHIRDCVALVKQNRGVEISVHDVERFKKDETVRQHIKTGNTIGCFYIESPAMRHVLKKLNCEDYITLVAASSIIRPGVGRSGMMNEYIHRFHDPARVRYPHPGLEPLLKETYGVMVYQEDVIKVAHYWAGLDMADADLLRRATSFKYRSKSKMPLLKQKFFDNCRLRNYPVEAVMEVWRQIESFAEFSFCKAHSASFAVESYQSLFLKSHFPMEFMVAVINNFGGFYSHGNRELYFYELMRTGAKVEPPCINNSDYLTNIRGEQVVTGFVHIRDLEQELAHTIIAQRAHGPYRDMEDLVNRTGITAAQLNILVRVGALRFTGRNKKELLWEMDSLLRKKRKQSPANSLFSEPLKKLPLPSLPVYDLDDAYDEVELLGFPVCNPFRLVDDDPGKYIPAAELKHHRGKTITVLGYHITQKPIRTIRGEVMSFGTFIDSNRDWIDTVHFPDVYQQSPLYAGFYRITGKVTEEFGVYNLEVAHIERAGIKKRREQEAHDHYA